MVMSGQARPPSAVGTVMLVGLPEPHAARLTATIHERLNVDCAVAATVDALSVTAWVLCAPGWVDRVLEHLGQHGEGTPDRVAVLWGNRPLNGESQRWTDQGLTVLLGPLPEPVLGWVKTTVTHPREETFLTWQESAEAVHDEDWAWAAQGSESGVIPVRGQPALSPAAGVSSEALGGLPAISQRHPAGRVVAVYSSGGGVGKTTTAVYLATLATRRRHRAMVLEMDEDRRGILTYWNQRPRGEGLDSIPAADWTDLGRLAERLATLAVTVTPRLTVVPMAGTVTGLQYPVAEGEVSIARLLAWARQHGGWTFVDLPARLRDHTILSVLKIVDQVLWVVEPTELMLDSSRLYLDLLEQLGPEGVAVVRKVSLLVNKVEKARAARLDSRAFAEALGLPLLGSIASNPVKYLSGINQHRIDPTPEWESVADRLGMSKAESHTGHSRGWWRSRERRKEHEP